MSIVYTVSMKLIIALGNPEKKYDNTRHNVGFTAIDTYVANRDISWKESTKFKSIIAELPNKTLLVKPTTYYNLSGEAVRAIADFYKIAPQDILVIHDDHALPFGTLRTRAGGSDAGNNGIKSINAHIPGTHRLRIGTHAEHREQSGDIGFVLGKFSESERQALALLQKYINKVIDDFRVNKFIATTYQLDAEQLDDDADKE